MPAAYPFQPTLKVYPDRPDAADAGNLLAHHDLAPLLNEWMGQSDRISTQVVGRSTEGRDLYLVTITAPETKKQARLAGALASPHRAQPREGGHERAAGEGLQAAGLVQLQHPRQRVGGHRRLDAGHRGPRDRAGRRGARPAASPPDLLLAHAQPRRSFGRHAGDRARAQREPRHDHQHHAGGAVVRAHRAGHPRRCSPPTCTATPTSSRSSPAARRTARTTSTTSSSRTATRWHARSRRTWSPPTSRATPTTTSTSGEVVPANTGENTGHIAIPYRDTPSGWDDFPPIFTAQYAAFFGAITSTVELPLYRTTDTDQSPENAVVNTAVAKRTIESMVHYVDDHGDDLLANQIEVFRRGVDGDAKTSLTDDDVKDVDGPREWRAAGTASTTRIRSPCRAPT